MSHKTTTTDIENDHPTRSVCVPYLSFTAFYSQVWQHFSISISLCKHLIYITKNVSLDFTTYSIQAQVIMVRYFINRHNFTSHFCYTFSVVPCIQLLAEHAWAAYDFFFFFSFFFFSFGFIAGYLITVPTGKRPAEHTERLSLDNILLRCILKAQWQQKSCRSCTSCINNELSDPVITLQSFLTCQQSVCFLLHSWICVPSVSV